MRRHGTALAPGSRVVVSLRSRAGVAFSRDTVDGFGARSDRAELRDRAGCTAKQAVRECSGAQSGARCCSGRQRGFSACERAGSASSAGPCEKDVDCYADDPCLAGVCIERECTGSVYPDREPCKFPLSSTVQGQCYRGSCVAGAVPPADEDDSGE
jgi:hypothetical protein